MVRPEAQGRGAEASHTLNKQPRPGQQDQRERELRNNQSSPRAVADCAARETSTGFFQHFVQVQPRGLASSFCLSTARPSSKLATLRQAIKRTTTTAANRRIRLV